MSHWITISALSIQTDTNLFSILEYIVSHNCVYDSSCDISACHQINEDSDSDSDSDTRSVIRHTSQSMNGLSQVGPIYRSRIIWLLHIIIKLHDNQQKAPS